MRRRLVILFVAISTMVALAFVLPLAFLVKSTAEDRALDTARADASAIVPVLVSEGSRTQIEAALGATEAGRDGRMTIRSPTGWTIGAQEVSSDRLDRATTTGSSEIGSIDDGAEVVMAVSSAPDELWGIRVFVPSAMLRQGQWRAWASLAAVAVALVGISVAVADQLARSIVQPTKRLALAAVRLGSGELDTRVEPSGPPELVELSGAFNDLGSQVSSMLSRERELVAELSHRLRTPLTKLRMRLDNVADPALAAELRNDLDDVTLTVNQLIAEARSSLAQEEERGCEAGEVVAGRVDFWSVLAEDQARPLAFKRPNMTYPVTLSEADLVAVIDVLLENVFTHTPETAPVDVGLHSADGMVHIWVEDSGPGVPETALERGVSTAGSTGLGLDIARRTASRSGGTFSITESSTGGTRVEIAFPSAPERPSSRSRA